MTGVRELELQSEVDARRSLRRSRGLHLASILAVAYLLVIAYASLQPFSGWWTPPEDIRRFLSAPWPRYITLEDVLVNIAAYVPLGFLIARALLRTLGNARAVLCAIGLVAVTSTGMEAVQMFMPSRIASNVDVLTNTMGGMIGALAAPLFSPTRLLGMRVARLRRAWFVYGPASDIGLVLLALWLATQLHPTMQLFGTGYLRNTFDVPSWVMHTPSLLLVAEAAVTGFNVVGLGLVIVALARPRVSQVAVLAIVLGSAFAVKTFVAVAVAKTAGPLAWLTPGVAVGVITAGLALYGLSRLPARALWLGAAVSFAAAIVAINLGPENPYQTIPPQLLGGPTHFLSFSG